MIEDNNAWEDDLPDDYFPDDATSNKEVWAIDKKTGKRYKKLQAPPPEKRKRLVRSKGRINSISQLRTMVEEDDDIGGFFGMDEAASIFLPHLQVPPTKKELADLEREREQAQKEKLAAYKRDQMKLKEQMQRKKKTDQSEEE